MITSGIEPISKPFHLAKLLEVEKASPDLSLTSLQLLRTFKMLEEAAKISDFKTEINEAMILKTKMNEFGFTANVLHFANIKSIDFTLKSMISAKIKSFYTKINSFYILENHFSPLYLFHKEAFQRRDLKGYFSVDFNVKSIDFILKSIVPFAQNIVYSHLKPQSDFLRLIDASGGKLLIDSFDLAKMKNKTNDFKFISFQFNDFHFSLHTAHFMTLVKTNAIEFTEEKGKIYCHLSSDYWTKTSTEDYLK